MKKTFFCCVVLSVLVIAGIAQASSYNEVFILTGPPEHIDPLENDEVYGYSETDPVFVSYIQNYETTYKKASAQASWDQVGGTLNRKWDHDDTGWTYIYADIPRDFRVTAAGLASISFTVNGSMAVEASGDAVFSGDFYIFANATVDSSLTEEDYTWEADIEWYEEFDGINEWNISETETLDFDFDASDIGKIFNVDLYFDAEVGPWSNPTNPNPISIESGSLEFSLDFNPDSGNGLKLNYITGGIEAVGGPAPPAVPIPGAAWLMGSVVLGLVGIRRKSRKQ